MIKPSTALPWRAKDSVRHQWGGAAARGGYRTQLVPVSAEDLERSADKLNRWILGLPRDVSSQINQIVIDVLNSQIVVDIADTQVARMLNLPTLIASVRAGRALEPVTPALSSFVIAANARWKVR